MVGCWIFGKENTIPLIFLQTLWALGIFTLFPGFASGGLARFGHGPRRWFEWPNENVFVCPQANMVIAVEVTKVKIQKRVSQREYGGHEKDCEACKTQFFMDGLFPRS